MELSKDGTKELKVRCSIEEWEMLKQRSELSGLNSLSRYLLECGLNVRGIQDWQERAMRNQLISSLIMLSNLLIKDVSGKEKEVIAEDLASLKEYLEELINLHKTNLLSEEKTSLVPYVEKWNYYEKLDSQLEH